MKKLTDELKNSLTEHLFAMNYTDLQATLLLIVAGCDPDYAILTVLASKRLIYV